MILPLFLWRWLVLLKNWAPQTQALCLTALTIDSRLQANVATGTYI